MNSHESIGLLETKSIISAAYAAEVMLASYKVKLAAKNVTPGHSITITIRGDQDSINKAIEAGITASKRLGEYIDSRIIPQPHPGLINIIEGSR